jgi:lysophospholipase L1-like esterase
MAGTNDVRIHCAALPEPLLSPQETARNIQLISRLVESQTSAHLVWLTPPPVDEQRIQNHWFFNEQCQVMLRNQDIAAITDILNKQSGLIVDIHSLFDTQTMPTLLREDGIHPSLQGQKVIVRALVTALAA